MADSKVFLAPKFTGKRFEDHTLPVELLEDFTAIEELIFELAKRIYLEENPGRKRVPKRFTEGVNLKLSNIEPGSTIPQLLLISTLSPSSLLGIVEPDSFRYFEKAKEKVISVIDSADKGKNFYGLVEPKYLSYFNKIGKNLKEDEAIFFQPNSSSQPARLNRSSRKKIILASDEKSEYKESVAVNALVPVVDKNTKTFILEIEGNKISLPIDPRFIETIKQTYDEYETKTLVAVKGLGVYNHQDKLIKIESIESMDILDPLDVMVRLNSLSKLKDGWYNNEGLAPNTEKLLKFGELFEEKYDKTLPLPAIYPTLDGNIQLEWSSENSEISLEVKLSNYVSEYYSTKFDEDSFTENKLDLNQTSAWIDLSKFLEKDLKA